MDQNDVIDKLSKELMQALSNHASDPVTVCRTYLQYALAYGAENPPKDQKINLNYQDGIGIDWMLKALENKHKTDWYLDKKIA